MYCTKVFQNISLVFTIKKHQGHCQQTLCPSTWNCGGANVYTISSLTQSCLIENSLIILYFVVLCIFLSFMYHRHMMWLPELYLYKVVTYLSVKLLYNLLITAITQILIYCFAKIVFCTFYNFLLRYIKIWI